LKAQLNDVLERALRRHGRPERDVDHRLVLHLGRLGGEGVGIGHHSVVVVGHVDHGRDPAGGRGERAGGDPLLGGAARVHVSVHHAGQEEGITAVQLARCGEGRLRSGHHRDQAVGQAQLPRGGLEPGKGDPAADHEVEVSGRPLTCRELSDRVDSFHAT